MAVSKYSILEVCALQWSKSLKSTLKSLQNLKENIDYISLRYESLVNDPVCELERVAQFAGIRDISPIRHYAEVFISGTYKGSWKKKIAPEEEDLIIRHAGTMLKKLDYL